MKKSYFTENQIIIPSYTHYGGLAGFHDYGIIGFQLKSKLMTMWRESFIRDNVYEVETPTIMHHAVLKASGHVERFTDYVVYDGNGSCYRADHLAKRWFNENNMSDKAAMVDSFDDKELEIIINQYQMLGKVGNGQREDLGKVRNGQRENLGKVENGQRENLGKVENGQRENLGKVADVRVQKKNLMIDIQSTAVMDEPDFLRPELAQGIFVNFGMYQQYLCNPEAGFKPFGIAQIGRSYRKEISPQPFTRLREFTQAELEYFVDPINKTHSDYDLYKNCVIPILTDTMQETGLQAIKMPIDDAHKQGLISHKLMACFLGKIYCFAKNIGLHDNKIRFRQHQSNEMAHYAIQCWDLECLTDDNVWLECVGCADRGSYDLTSHKNLTANRLIKPYGIKRTIIQPNIRAMARLFGKNTEEIKLYFQNLDLDTCNIIAKSIERGHQINCNINDYNYDFGPELFSIIVKESVITTEKFIPHVIEPSFGIDRLIYVIICQNLSPRPTNERRLVLSLPDSMTCYQVAVFPLHKKESMIKMANSIRSILIKANLKCFIDDSSVVIGKKYIRCDEIGVPYVVSVDPGSLETGMVTLRDRNTMNQIVVHHDSLINHLKID